MFFYVKEAAEQSNMHVHSVAMRITVNYHINDPYHINDYPQVLAECLVNDLLNITVHKLFLWPKRVNAGDITSKIYKLIF